MSTFLATSRPVRLYPSIKQIIRMALRAVSLFGTFGGWANTPQNVLPVCNQFEMFRVTTLWIAAQMVKLQSARNVPLQEFISDAVRGFHPRTIPEHAITLMQGGCPQPARLGFLNLRPKAFFHGRHNKTLRLEIEAHSASRGPLSRTRGHGVIIAC